VSSWIQMLRSRYVSAEFFLLNIWVAWYQKKNLPHFSIYWEWFIFHCWVSRWLPWCSKLLENPICLQYNFSWSLTKFFSLPDTMTHGFHVSCSSWCWSAAACFDLHPYWFCINNIQEEIVLYIVSV
jgi:hypothetical protein